jgi:electron transfer flavoprotein alpha subunit
MDSAKQTAPHGKVTFRKVTEELTSSRIKVLRIEKKPEEVSITEADVLVVAGQGITEKEDLALVKELAHLLGGEYACTRPMVEKGWCDYTRQIGLSGRTVKPKLIITCGVSGAIQFTACMDSSERIVAINSDKNAPIFKTAHVGIIGDIYEIIPGLIEKIKGAKEYAV